MKTQTMDARRQWEKYRIKGVEGTLNSMSSHQTVLKVRELRELAKARRIVSSVLNSWIKKR